VVRAQATCRAAARLFGDTPSEHGSVLRAWRKVKVIG
jgi:hypothetical protein